VVVALYHRIVERALSLSETTGGHPVPHPLFVVITLKTDVLGYAGFDRDIAASAVCALVTTVGSGFVDMCDTSGQTVLHKAAKNPSLCSAQLLIELGASVNLAEREDGYTPLHHSIESQPAEDDTNSIGYQVMLLLLEHGADANADHSSRRPLSLSRI